MQRDDPVCGHPRVPGQSFFQVARRKVPLTGVHLRGDPRIRPPAVRRREKYPASSTTHNVGRSSAAAASRPSTAAEISRRSACADGASPSAPASACDWASGSAPRQPKTGRSSSCSPANARSDSASTPTVDRTSIGPACCLAYSSSADLPIPASPRTTSAPPLPARASSSNRSMAAHSASRPSSRGPASCGVGPVIARMVARVATAAQARAGRGTGDLTGDPTGDFPDASQPPAGRRWWGTDSRAPRPRLTRSAQCFPISPKR